MNVEINPLGLPVVKAVSIEGLAHVGKRAKLSTYLKALWRRRHFIYYESQAKIQGGTRKDILGFLWLFINPLLSVFAFWFIFGFILQASKGVDNFIGYLVIGVFFFQYTNRTVTGGSGAVKAGASMIRGFQFPRAALPVSVVLRNFLDFVPSVGIMVMVIAVIPPLEHITWRVILVVPIIALQTIFNIGLACLLARLCHMVPDLSNLMTIFSRFWLYGSGVFFGIDQQLAEHPQLLSIMHFNPMYAYLELTRDALLYGIESPMWMWASAVIWAFGLLIIGFIYFWRGEESYGRFR